MSLATAEQNTPEAVSGHDSSAHGAAGHGKKGLGNPILGMLLFIVSEIRFFGGLFAAYFSLRTSAVVWPPEGNEAFLLHEEALFPGLMTLLLLISSLTCQIAVWRIRRGDRVGMNRALLMTVVLGIIFLIGQVVEPPDAGRLDAASLAHLPEPRWLLARRLEADVVPLEIRAKVRVGGITAEDG